ncbi:hypothetical protein [Laspinema palackyanum]
MNVVFAIASVFLLFVIGAVFHLISNQTSEQLKPERDPPQRLEIKRDRR